MPGRRCPCDQAPETPGHIQEGHASTPRGEPKRKRRRNPGRQGSRGQHGTSNAQLPARPSDRRGREGGVWVATPHPRACHSAGRRRRLRKYAQSEKQSQQEDRGPAPHSHSKVRRRRKIKTPIQDHSESIGPTRGQPGLTPGPRPGPCSTAPGRVQQGTEREKPGTYKPGAKPP